MEIWLACLYLPTVLPPGSETLALDILTSNFQPIIIRQLLRIVKSHLDQHKLLRQDDDHNLATTSKSSSDEGQTGSAEKQCLARISNFEQLGDAERSQNNISGPTIDEDLTEPISLQSLSNPEYASEALLNVYALSYLGLKLEQSDGGRQTRKGARKQQKAESSVMTPMQSLGSPLGSFLPLKNAWLYDWVSDSLVRFLIFKRQNKANTTTGVLESPSSVTDRNFDLIL